MRNISEGRIIRVLGYSLRKRVLLSVLLFCAFAVTSISAEEGKSMKERSTQIPDWFDESKMGIFIHWGLPSVPAFASGRPYAQGELDETGGWGNNREIPYSEWYQFSLQYPKGDTRRWHDEKYGADFPYDAFQPMFEENIKDWDPEKWAELFASFGAKYVVLVTKHHDGYTLWPSEVENPNKDAWGSQRDLVGELASAVRAKGMRFGTYYSTGLDWTFSLPKEGDDYSRFIKSAPLGKEYGNYVYEHIQEIVDRYKPDVLWADIGYPSSGHLDIALEHYFEAIPHGVVNDRWGAFDKQSRIANLPWGMQLLKILNWFYSDSDSEVDGWDHYGYRTSEYTSLDEVQPYIWESTRGLGGSFAYNHLETEEDMLNGDELISFLIDTVSKNGNILINVGPDSFGNIPSMQQKPLKELGAWLKVNGDAIYATRPWERFGYDLPSGGRLRFTQDDNNLYAIIVGDHSREIVLEDLGFEPKIVKLLGQGNVPFSQKDKNLVIQVGPYLEGDSAKILQISKI